jgi:phosphoenolpyruvate synthase/pyruvate phosphate dikinase
MVLDRHAALGAPLGQAGGKASRLARLAAAGLPVPDFFVVTAEALAQHLREGAIAWPPEPDPAAWQVTREALLSAPVPAAVRRPVLHAYEALVRPAAPAVAVRSSGAGEDAAQASFAGQFATILNVTGEVALLNALRACWASSLSERSLGYRQGAGVPLEGTPAFAVIVQVQVPALKAGVLFTRHPVTPEEGSAYLEANYGTGESVVGGLVTPDGITVAREGAAGGSATVVDLVVGTKRRMSTLPAGGGPTTLVEVEPARRRAAVLTGDEAVAIARLGWEIEEIFGEPQDVEWACDEDRVWILQARPVTTGAMARPVARTEAPQPANGGRP